MLLIRRVSGASMQPALNAGDIVVARKKQPKIGDIVIAKAGGREVIKRVTRQSPTALFLAGDNTGHSTDSRSYGEVPYTALLGVVIFTFYKKKP